MDVGRITGNTAVAMPGRSERATEPLEQETAQEPLPREEAQCTLQISDEGYHRWELSQEDLPQKKQYEMKPAEQQDKMKPAEQQDPVQPQNGVLPQAGEASQAEAVPLVSETAGTDLTNRLTRLLDFLDSRAYYLAHAKPEATKETDDEKVAALEEMQQLREEQEELYLQKEAKAQALAKKRAKSRNVVEKGMRELTIMLESVRPMERDKDPEKKTDAGDKDKNRENERQNDTVIRRGNEEDAPDTRETMQGFGRQVKRHAFHKELAMDRTIDLIYKNTRKNFEMVRTSDRKLMDGLQEVYHVLEQKDVSEADKAAAVDRYLENAAPIFGDIKNNMGMGLERLNNLRLIRLEQPGNQNMVYASRSQDAIYAMADENALDELYQDSFKQFENESFEELAEQIRKLQEEERTEETRAEENEQKETGQTGSIKADGKEIREAGNIKADEKEDAELLFTAKDEH